MEIDCIDCRNALEPKGPPSLCGVCGSATWAINIPNVGLRFCDYDSHIYGRRVGDGKYGHRVHLEPHTKERCQRARLGAPGIQLPT